MADLTGLTLGRYQLTEKLGRGGMADVYKAFQPGLDRYVAIKVMHPHLATETNFIERFQREARSVAALRHQHIVQVFDFDTQDDTYFMVMEFIEGKQTLKELLQDYNTRGEHLPLGRAIEIVAKLADALEYAHGEGMIHRDIKPANVLLQNGDPVLSDFGIARMLGQTGLTATGAMIGTPAYMSPEQGRSEIADERSDIYALGIILYELITGAPPYDADTPYGVILKHINDPLVTPRQMVAGIPDSVERVVLKSLAKAPEERYQTAAELRDALRATLYGSDTVVTPAAPTVIEPIPAAADEQTMPVTPQPVTRKRPRWLMPAVIVGLLAIVAAVVLLAAGILGGDGLAVSPEPGQQPIDDSPPAALSAEREEAAMLVVQGFELWPDDHEQAVDKFHQALVLDPENVPARIGLARFYYQQDNLPEFLQMLEQAREIDPGNPFTHYADGLLHCCTDGYYELDRAFEAFSAAIEGCGDITWLCADAHHQRSGLAAWAFGDFDLALADIGQAIELESNLYQRTDYMSYRADYLIAVGDHDAAIAELITAYEQAEPGELAWLLESAAEKALIYTGDSYLALRLYDRLITETHGEPRYLIGRAYTLMWAGDIEDAYAEVALAQEFDADYLPAIYLEALLALQTGDADLAVDLFTRILEREDEWMHDYSYWDLFDPDTGHALHYDYAQALYAQGRYDEALAAVERTLAEDDWWHEPYLLRGDIFRELGDIAAARESYLRLLEIAQEHQNEYWLGVAEDRLAELTQ